MKCRFHLIFSLVLLCFTAKAGAQAVNNTGIERDIHREKYLRLQYGNDYFTATDYYLTQSIYAELSHPALRALPVYKILYHPRSWETRYSIAAEHNGYTPVYYERKEIQYGDRPFAGALFLKFFTVSTDTGNKQRLTSSLSSGVLGQAAGTKEMQTFIHENTGNVLPQGWPNQIRNDLVLNYEINYQKQLFAVDNLLMATADAMARLGTLSTRANVGVTVIAGYFNSPFAPLSIRGRKVQLYAYDRPEIAVIGYDATLQGGLFNRSSPYTIAGRDINRIVFRNQWGFAARIGRCYLEYYQSFVTREFASGMDFRNGGIQVGYSF